MTYVASWVVGVISIVFLVWRRDVTSLFAILVLGALSLLAPPELTPTGFRYIVFLSIYLVLANHLTLDPKVHVCLQGVFLGLSFLSADATFERFSFGTSVMLLMVGMTKMHPGESSNVARIERAKGALFIVISLAVSVIGYGSRSALFVWLFAQIREKIWPLALVSVMGMGVVMFSPLGDSPFMRKLGSSFVELSEPTSLHSGEFNLRAYELALFYGLVERETIGELLAGSDSALFLPSEYFSEDANGNVPYIPHNQIAGILYQFGLIGLITVVVMFWRTFNSFKRNKFSRSLFLALLLPFFLFKHGFLDTDLALIVSSLNWLRKNRT